MLVLGGLLTPTEVGDARVSEGAGDVQRSDAAAEIGPEAPADAGAGAPHPFEGRVDAPSAHGAPPGEAHEHTGLVVRVVLGLL